MSRRRTTWFPALLILVAAGLGCAINPATGRRQLTLMSERQEIAVGRESDQQVVASMGSYDDEALQSYVQSLGRKLAALSERPDLDWHFRVVDDPVVNAFALPGGYIYITRGIMAHLNNEAELASVIGHEIGHVTARHGVNQMSKAQLAQLGLGVGVIVGGEAAQTFGNIAAQGLGLLFLKFSRDDERQADDLGLRYLLAAGYDPRPMPEVFEVLRRVSADAGGDRIPGWLSTHPEPENRRARLEAAIAARGGSFDGRRVDQPGYYAKIEGMVFGPDPRQGYFKEQRFYHPAMAFRLEFPPGWKTANQRQSVLAVSPEQDALVSLQLSREATPAQALTKFLEPESVREVGAWRSKIHGYDVASREFAATTDSGEVRGIVAFLRHGELSFQLIAYAPATKWDARRAVAEAALASFDRLTDSAALAVRPKRLRTVDPGAPMALDQFAAKFEATVPASTLALINHLESGARLQPGARYKIVQEGRLP